MRGCQVDKTGLQNRTVTDTSEGGSGLSETPRPCPQPPLSTISPVTEQLSSAGTAVIRDFPLTFLEMLSS